MWYFYCCRMTRQTNLCVDSILLAFYWGWCQVVEAYWRIRRTRARYSVWRVLMGAKWKDLWVDANGLTGLFANVINVEIPRVFARENDAMKFCRRHTFNGLIVESKSNIGGKISLSRDDHELGFRGIGGEMIQTKLVMNEINIRLKVNKIRRSSDVFFFFFFFFNFLSGWCHPHRELKSY